MIILLASCKKGKTEFFILEDLTYFTGSTMSEDIVILNPPLNRDTLMKLIEMYNDTTLTPKQILGYERVTRSFYKEGGKLRRGYTEESGHFGDRINQYNDQYLFEVVWSSGSYGQYVHYKFFTNGHLDSMICKEYPSMKERYRMR